MRYRPFGAGISFEPENLVGLVVNRIVVSPIPSFFEIAVVAVCRPATIDNKLIQVFPGAQFYTCYPAAVGLAHGRGPVLPVGEIAGQQNRSRTGISSEKNVTAESAAW